MTDRISNQISTNHQTNDVDMVAVPAGAEDDPDNEREGYRLFSYNNEMHYLPQSFEFPRGMNFKAMMGLLLLGMPEQQVPPLRILNESFDVMHLKRDKQQLTDMRPLMKLVKREAKAVNPTL